MHRHSPLCPCRGGAGRGWPNNRRVLRQLVAGLDPIVHGVSGALDAAYSNGMAGRTGARLRGNSADNEWGWRGYLPYQRVLAIRPGAGGNLRLEPSRALPATHGEVRQLGASTTVLEHLARIAPSANYGGMY